MARPQRRRSGSLAGAQGSTPGPAAKLEALEDRKQLLFSNAIYRLGEWIDLWQDCRSLQDAILCERQDSWRAVYRHWRLGRLTPFLDRGMMLYSVASTVLAIIVASVLWILLGWPTGAAP
jgi:hypothetical protein